MLKATRICNNKKYVNAFYCFSDNEMKIILIIIALIVAVLGIYKKNSWPLKVTISISGLLLIGAIFGAIFQIAIEMRDAKEKAKLKYVGTLDPPSKFLLSTRKNILPKMGLGDGGTIFVWGGPQGQPLFRFFDNNAFVIIMDNDQVKISAIIRNKDGIALAELVNNEWKVNKNNTFDRNYSKDALEVKDNSGDIVLQVKILNDRIQFQGKFYDRNGNGVALGRVEGGGIIEWTGIGHPQLELKIKPIFQYPSDNHLGEFCDKRL